MIESSTTFVIGAGASVDYGLPASVGLREAAIKILPQTDIGRMIINGYNPQPQLEEFVADLRRHPANSIDAFLKHRQHNESRMRIGRRVIAALLGSCIAQKPKPVVDGKWLRIISRHLTRGARSWSNFVEKQKSIPLTFVTFNFDSVIEYNLDHDLRGAFDDARKDEIEALFPVLHVHGRLPAPPMLPRRGEVLRIPEWEQWLGTAAPHVGVVHDDIPQDIVDRARRALREADVVCFLGFAFDPVNLQRLDARTATERARSNGALFGSALKMPPSQQERVKSYFGHRINLGDMTCDSLLEQFYILRE